MLSNSEGVKTRFWSGLEFCVGSDILKLITNRVMLGNKVQNKYKLGRNAGKFRITAFNHILGFV